MKKRIKAIIIFLSSLLFIISTSGFASESRVFDVPRIEGITADGSAEDWGKQGFRVDFLTDPDGRALPADDFDVKFRLGWNSQGLLVLATVHDDIPTEHQHLSELWRCDCLEIFMADRVGSENRYQLVIASGADPTFKTVRSHFYDWRPEDRRPIQLTSQTSSRALEGGYVVETLLPWKNLEVEPKLGLELGFQFAANDFEGNIQQSDSLRVSWFPGLDPADPKNMHRIRLSEKPSDVVLYRVDREIVLGGCTLSLRGSRELIGESIEVRSGKDLISRGKMELICGRASFQSSLPLPEDKGSWPQVEVLIGGKLAASFEELPTLNRVMERYLEAVGGKEALAKVATRKCTGQLIHDYPGQKPQKVNLPVEIYAAVPDKWRLIIHTSKGIQQMGFDGEHGWLQNADRIQLDSRQQRSKLAYLFNPQGALHLEEYFPRLMLKDKVIQKGRKVYAVKPTGPGSAQELLHFDAESGLLTRIGDNLEIQDYREEDGIMHPVRIAIAREGGSSTYVFDSIKTNAPLEAELFAIPDLGEVFPDVFEGLPDKKVVSMLKDFPSGHEEMSVPCRDGRFLYDFIIQHKYKRGLEIGTYTGYSALWMGLALEQTGGKMITIEYDATSGQIARRNILKAGLEGVIDSRIADAFEEIPRIEGEFDFIFIDAWKPDYVKFLRLLRNRVVPGGAIIAHNVTNYTRDMQEYLDAIKNDPGLETTFEELSVEGMSVSIVRKLKPSEGISGEIKSGSTNNQDVSSSLRPFRAVCRMRQASKLLNFQEYLE
jgi:predicted O-methyltransferase YrrM